PVRRLKARDAFGLQAERFENRSRDPGILAAGVDHDVRDFASDAAGRGVLDGDGRAEHGHVAHAMASLGVHHIESWRRESIGRNCGILRNRFPRIFARGWGAIPGRTVTSRIAPLAGQRKKPTNTFARASRTADSLLPPSGAFIIASF